MNTHLHKFLLCILFNPRRALSLLRKIQFNIFFFLFHSEFAHNKFSVYFILSFVLSKYFSLSPSSSFDFSKFAHTRTVYTAELRVFQARNCYFSSGGAAFKIPRIHVQSTSLEKERKREIHDKKGQIIVLSKTAVVRSFSRANNEPSVFRSIFFFFFLNRRKEENTTSDCCFSFIFISFFKRIFLLYFTCVSACFQNRLTTR